MKNIKHGILIISVITTLVFLSCDSPVGLGSMLDMDGPIVEIISPLPRKAVPAQFEIEGTVEDTSTIQRLLVTATREGDAYPKQWRYTRGTGWEVSEDSGVTWVQYAVEGLRWEDNDNFITWLLYVDLTINGIEPEDGEYLFTVQAWDSGGMSDDNSLRTRVLIFDKDPPKVDIVNPVLFRGINALQTEPLKSLHEIPDDGNERFDPSNIGRFVTQGFQMHWQVEDNHDVWSIDLRFYKHNVNVDGYPETPLPEDYIFRYYRNLPPPPEAPEPQNNIRPNGRVEVPALDGTSALPHDGELRNPITEKTTVMVVATCYDAAGNPNQEKVLGYFIYWSKADIPWIVFTDGMESLDYYNALMLTPEYNGWSVKDVLENEDVFMIYPGRTIRATAYHNHGVERVNFRLYEYDESTGNVSPTPLPEFTNGEFVNTPRPNGSLSTIFPWEFRPPSRSGYYVLKATTTSVSGRVSDDQSALFRVQDITFPDFPEPISPNASDPLFTHINVVNNSITISGIVRDATLVENLDMVWINPQSAGYATMSQIRYFREPEYAGWQKAIESTGGVKSIDLTANGNPVKEAYLESQHTNNAGVDCDGELNSFNICNKCGKTVPTHPNLIWRLALEHEGEDNETKRQVFSFSITINLDDLNIGTGEGRQPLTSQMFLFKAENPDRRNTIITYAPQGDTSPPEISILNVDIDGERYTPRSFGLIPRFVGNETITINGWWREDSAKYLPVNNYFADNFSATINTIQVNQANITVTSVPSATEGTWTAVVRVGTDINANELRDSLVITAGTHDIGGNLSEDGASWLIESDDLRLLRISSSDPDQTYKAGDVITIFLEFSKPVRLRFGVPPPVLVLNSAPGARAHYVNNDSQSTRQEFSYVVGAGHRADPLDVTGIETSIAWNDNNYPFTWYRGSDELREEIRVTMVEGHTGTHIHDPNDPPVSLNPPLPSGRLYARRLPVPVTSGGHDSDHQFTLGSGKNIVIDTAPPTVRSVFANTAEGHYSTGTDIFITVEFNKPVRIGSVTPRLTLAVNNGGNTSVLTSGEPSSIRVSGNRMTFSYSIREGDTTGANAISVTGFTGEITDLAGTPLAANGIATATLDRIFINTIAPAAPTVRLLPAGDIPVTDDHVVVNNVNGTDRHGRSNTTENRELSNVYHPQLWLAIQPSAGTHNLHTSNALEYSINNGDSWVPAPNNENIPFDELQPGISYRLIARQTDMAGNVSVSDPSEAITFRWNPGNLISRVDSTTANGTYTNNAQRTDPINITVHFRENIIITENPTITLNTTPVRTVTALSVVLNQPQNSISFTYNVNSNDNTPSGSGREQYLDVTAINITAIDQDGVRLNSYISIPGAGVADGINTGLNDPNRLRQRRDIIVQTGPLTLAAGVTEPTFRPVDSTIIRNDDAWTGSFSLEFNRNISKGSGNVTITQRPEGYRLPAVLTNTQAARYRNIENFNEFYLRGVNGFSDSDGVPDTSTKWILRYDLSTVVTPNQSAAAGTIERLAWDFLQAERVVLPVTSQDIQIVNGNTLQINLSGSNALQVLGAQYDIVLSPNFVQDALSFGWPADVTTYTYTTTEINRPFIRVDKKVNEDRIIPRTGTTTRSQLLADFSNVIVTRARLDCRTPNSVVRYNTVSEEHTNLTINAHGHGNGQGGNWRNSGNSDSSTVLEQPALDETGANGTTTYNTFTGSGTVATGPHISVGTTAETGYTWRIAAISRNSTGNIDSDIHEEIAYRTVLTYELSAVQGSNQGGANIGYVPVTGNSLWIRGGDAVSSSSVPGFPLTWSDDYNSLSQTGRRAGVRLMRQVADGTGGNLRTTNWRWITWEINVRTWHDVILGENFVESISTPTATDALDAWQYGPPEWRYKRGGWAASKDLYTLYPGRHRVVRLIGGENYSPGGQINWTNQINVRARPAVTHGLTMPP